MQFDNNITYEYNYVPPEDFRFFYPLLNFTGMMAIDLAEIPLQCYEFSIEFEDYWEAQGALMNNDPSLLLQAFLFTQMSNAINYKNSIDTIDENNQE